MKSIKLFKNNLDFCPKLAKLITANQDSINIAGLSLMRPDSEISEHTDTTGLQHSSMAYHLGLIIPDSKKCILTVNGETKNQKPGQSIVFDSTYKHSAKNNTDRNRVILYIDFKI